ncbi:hypothetical protein F4861DRAFT_512775 [Xylaria intraflava]|nr:hypothetical protein F4861DRAFT_512775 [Xylaria intraflava]
MASSDDPPEGHISQLCEFLGMSRAEAIRRLKLNSNNLDSALNEYLDDPDSTKFTWDESHFNTDREGETNAAGISFNIQGADELPPLSHVNSAAPTRPPSRTNNRSPLGGLVNASQEDADFARALAESAAESGIAPQEVGVMNRDSTNATLRPANRSNYDSDMWAVVPTKAMVEAETANPPPSVRKRDVDAPAFLRQTNDHRIGSVLSIYSKIPLARNAMLRSGKPALTYGHNTEWWQGKPILRQDVLAKMARGEDVWGDDTHPDFIEELHRLLAFLDKSERSYASVDNLTETKAIDGGFGSWTTDVEHNFFQALQETNIDTPESGMEQMINTGKVIQVSPSVSDQADLDIQNEEEEGATMFIYLDISLDSDTYSCVNTLYDALDHLFWTSALSLDYSFPENAKSAVLLKPAEVLTIRVGSGGLVKPCEMPAVFYADRYMDDNRELALHFQTQMREIKDALKKLDWSKEERVTCAGQLCCFNLQRFSLGHDIRECCTDIIKYAEQLLERQKKDAQWRHFQDQWEKSTPYSMDDLRLIHTWSGPLEFTDEERMDRERLEHIIEVCKDKLEEAERALIDFEQKKEELNGYLDVVRKRLTCQEDEADNDRFVFRSHGDAYRPEYWNPSSKYLLRGVATTYDVAYVCTRDEEDASIPLPDPAVRDQWWKIGYVKGDASPIKSEKVTLDDVLQAAGTESKNPILIYASEAALNQERIPLPDALRMFIKADNRSFQQELAQEESTRESDKQNQEVQMIDQTTVGVTAATLSQIPSDSKGKRKHSVGSSVATNGSIRSNLAEVDLAFDDDPPGVLEDAPKLAHPDNDTEIGDAFETLDEESGPLAQGKKHPEGHGQGVGRDLNIDATSIHKAPEMSERPGGVNLFLAQQGSSAQTPNPVDLMDLDTENETTND